MKPLLCLLLCWAVSASLLRVVDGDTADFALAIHLSTVGTLAQTVPERVRFLGVDTPEMTGATRPAGEQAKVFTEAWLNRGPVTISYCRRDSLRRLLGAVTRDGEDLAEALIRAGHGVKR